MSRFLARVAVSLAIAALGFFASLSRPFELIDRPLSDASLRVASALHPPLARDVPDVSIVEIDPRSLRAFPEWPWSRDRYAVVAERLLAAGARAVAFDIDLSTDRDAAGDDAFAATIRSRERIVLAALRQRQQIAGVGELEVVSLPAARFVAAGARIGHVVVPLDSDGVVRQARTRSELGGELALSLPAASLEIAGAQLEALDQKAHAIDYRRALPEIPRISIADVIEDRFDARTVDGRVVFVGATASEFQDFWTTPLGPARPGVWIQAVEYRTLAAAGAGAPTLTPAPRSFSFALCFLLALAGQLAANAGAGRRIGWFAALLALTLATCWAGLRGFGLQLSPLIPALQLACHYVAGVERVRRTLGVQLKSRELSLTTLHDLGESAAQARDDHGIEAGLQLLGRAVAAHAVALLRATPAGRLDGSRVDWRPHGVLAAVDEQLAESVLASRKLHAESVIPGRPGVRGRAVYVPLFAGQLAVGVLAVESRTAAPFSDVELRTVATVASQLALTIRSLRLAEDLRATLGASVEAIASAVEARDGYTELHCRRLALFSVSMAHRLGLPAEEIESIRLGALLHDVGKIGVRDSVLLKPGRFSAEERGEMERHASIGHRIVSPIAGLSATTLACVRSHHEKWDGSGYPDALAGSDIPLAARIVAIVDVWDALSSERPYKSAFAQHEVRDILQKSRGSHFDPALVDLFFRVLDDEGDEMLALVHESAEAAP